MRYEDQFPSESIYTGTNDDLQREKRMNNWIRAQSLAAPLRAEVERTMLNDPYDRNAGLRMEEAIRGSNDIIAPWQVKEQYAAKLFADDTHSPFRASGSPYAPPSPHAAVASPSPRQASQSAGPVAMAGSIASGSEFGPEMMVPTAGNYTNGAFANQMAQLGLSGSPTQEAYRNAVYNYRTPEQRNQVDIANIQADGRLGAALAKAGSDLGKNGKKTDYEKRLAQDDKDAVAEEMEIRNAYSRYQQQSAKDGLDPLPFGTWRVSDPQAVNIHEKHKAKAAITGRGERMRQTRQDRMARGDDPDAAAMGSLRGGIGSNFSSWLGGGDQSQAQPQRGSAQRIAQQSARVAQPVEQVQKDLEAAVEVKLQNMSEAQVLAEAKKHNVEAEVAQILADRRIRKVRHGSPALAPSERSNGGTRITDAMKAGAAADNAVNIQQDPRVRGVGNTIENTLRGRQFWKLPSLPTVQPRQIPARSPIA